MIADDFEELDVAFTTFKATVWGECCRFLEPLAAWLVVVIEAFPLRRPRP